MERETLTFTCPELPVAEIVDVLKKSEVSDLNPDALLNPTAELVCSLYTNFLVFVDPLGDAPDDQIGFAALELLDNPDHYVDSIRAMNLYRKVKDILTSIRYENFTLRDLLKPEAKRTIQILSTIVNFIVHRDEKLNKLQPIVDEFSGYEERWMELENKNSELNKEIMDLEVAHRLEEPLVQEVDAEVKMLKQSIQNYNKQQMSLKTVAKGLKEKTQAIAEKISQADFELLKNVQENSKLLPKIVQSPDKLQRALEEKKAHHKEVKNSEKLVMQSLQKKASTLEVYSKAYEKMSKHISQMQAIQEQVNKAKSYDKDVKVYKAKLSMEGVSNIALDAKIDEWQGKAKQPEGLIKTMKKEKDTRYEQDSQRIESLRRELEWKLHCLEPRDKEVEALVAKGDGLCSEADSVREAGKAEQQKLQAKLEKIVDAFHRYSDMVVGALQPLQRVEGLRQL